MTVARNQVDTSNAGATLEALVLGEQVAPTLSLGNVADTVLRNRADAGGVLVDYANRKVYLLPDADMTAYDNESSFDELYGIPTADEGRRTIEFTVAGRTRTATGTGGDTGLADILDPALPRVSLPSLLDKLEDAAIATVAVISQTGNAGEGHADGTVKAYKAATAADGAAVATLVSKTLPGEYVYVAPGEATIPTDQPFE